MGPHQRLVHGARGRGIVRWSDGARGHVSRRHYQGAPPALPTSKLAYVISRSVRS